ncbi:AAA family ATPase [Rhodococcus pyridinivorans]|uniref:AAA family ATPase n=1 Tax=Rhodococcus pyridinivorans TaxID=103816 RepID=UPI002227E4AF|nr:AAA family ATPase [Rhodococcus pyridinivorans]MCW3471857.1 AAA family ATPase [Rhodococcus pyridinivorans]
MPTENDIEADVRDVLKALAIRKNVLLAGPPGTGKSRLLNRVRELFEWKKGYTGAAPTAAIPLPAASGEIPQWFPSPDQDISRKVFQTVFDQNTKYRDFMRGLVPKIGNAGEFTVTSGTLYRASIHAQHEGNASLVIIDEINRGPAVAAFGSALVGLEPDKRLASDGTPTPTTQYFELLGNTGEHESFALPNDLYILAAMNEADTSVEPLDVAFLRRFAPYRLEPQVSVLRQHLALPADPATLPEISETAQDLYEALAQAWVQLNKQILLGRGQAYQLGHGALMHTAAPAADLGAAQQYVADAWSTLRGHIDEVFFGNTRALADLLRTGNNNSPYALEEATFAGQTVRRIVGPTRPTAEVLYRLLSLIAKQ